MKILLIEPYNDLAQTTKAWLENANHRVSISSTAQHAIHQAESSPDVVVLELALSGHNGLEFIYEFRSYLDWQNIPIIIYSHIPPEVFALSNSQKKRLNIVAHLYKPTTSFYKLEEVIMEQAVGSNR